MSGPAVLQVTLWKSPYLGNFMASQLRLAVAVRDRLGLGTHLVLADGARGQPWLADLDAAGVDWSILEPGRRAVRARLRALARQTGAAVVHSHFTAADVEAAAAAASVGAPCVWHLHTGFRGYPPGQRLKDLVKVRLVARRRVARVVAVAPWLAELARRRGVDARRIVVVPNAIVAERFADRPGRDAARAALGLPADAEIVLAFGWWPYVKGADVLLEALERLARRRPRLVGVLVGEQALRAFVAERAGPEPPPWLRLHGFAADPVPLFAAADAFASASRHEGQPYAVGEALSCAVPVVLSDIPGTAIYRAAPGARTFPSEDPAALAAALETTLAGGVGAAASAPAWVAERLGADAWCDALCALYEELLAGSPASRRRPIARSAARSSPPTSRSATSASR
jgi:glycosyltransferase involved in cell wall biosynthesis